MTEQSYDRSTQDVGNILALEHVTLTVPSQELATLFYVSAMGFTRDPYMMVGQQNMWINVGRQQFHLPTREPQLLRGYIGVAVPDLNDLTARLEATKSSLAGTAFSFAKEDGSVAVTCPWGNRFRCYASEPGETGMSLGIHYLEFSVPPGTAPGIGRFYGEAMEAPSTMLQGSDGVAVQVGIGWQQSLIFRETGEELPAYDGHHIAVYLANFSGPHSFLKRHGRVTEESNPHQYRFQDILDPETGETLFLIEHEVRSVRHPMYQRGLVNRDPAQDLRAYARGRDSLTV